jgi:hypothetical protein
MASCARCPCPPSRRLSVLCRKRPDKPTGAGEPTAPAPCAPGPGRRPGTLLLELATPSGPRPRSTTPTRCRGRNRDRQRVHALPEVALSHVPRAVCIRQPGDGAPPWRARDAAWHKPDRAPTSLARPSTVFYAAGSPHPTLSLPKRRAPAARTRKICFTSSSVGVGRAGVGIGSRSGGAKTSGAAGVGHCGCWVDGTETEREHTCEAAMQLSPTSADGLLRMPYGQYMRIQASETRG